MHILQCHQYTCIFDVCSYLQALSYTTQIWFPRNSDHKSPLCLTPLHSCHCISVSPSTIGNRNKLANCSTFLGHPSTDSGFKIANLWQVQTKQLTYFIFLSQKHDVEIKHSKEKAHKQHGWCYHFFCFSLWYNLDEPQDGKYTVSWMWRMMHLSQTTSLDLPKAQWKRITKRLPTLQENRWNLSVWADKRSTYNSFHRRCQTCCFGANIEGEWIPDTDKNWGWMKSEKSTISHKKFNPQINLPSYHQYAQPVSSEQRSWFLWGQKSTCQNSATPQLFKNHYWWNTADLNSSGTYSNHDGQSYHRKDLPSNLFVHWWWRGTSTFLLVFWCKCILFFERHKSISYCNCLICFCWCVRTSINFIEFVNVKFCSQVQ